MAIMCLSDLLNVVVRLGMMVFLVTVQARYLR